MQWVYLALTLLAAVLTVVANAMPLYHAYREHKKKQKENQDLLKQGLHELVGGNEAETHITTTQEIPRE